MPWLSCSSCVWAVFRHRIPNSAKKNSATARKNFSFSRRDWATTKHKNSSLSILNCKTLQDKKQAYNKEAWQKLRQGKNPNTTETEYGKIVEDVIQARIATDELELEYVRKYKQFLPAKKIYLLQKAEMRFHRELLKGFKHCQKGPGKKK